MRTPLALGLLHGLRPTPCLQPTTGLSRPPRWLTEQRERHGMVPVFTRNRLISLASSSAPAASPRLRRRPSSRPPYRHAKPATESTIHIGRSCTASRPISTRFEPVPRLRSFTTGSCRIPSDLARRTQPVWQYQAVPALSALLPTQGHRQSRGVMIISFLDRLVRRRGV